MCAQESQGEMEGQGGGGYMRGAGLRQSRACTMGKAWEGSFLPAWELCVSCGQGMVKCI